MIYRMARRGKGSRRKSRRVSHRGGGYSVDLSKMVAAGYPVNQAYSGTGKDCVGGSFDRPGLINSGLPGMRGGAVKQSGGRYEMNPGALLAGGSDIGMGGYSSPNRIACEGGYTNSLNMRGGGELQGAPLVQVGASDSMRYEASTAGYRNDFTTSSSGGMMIQTPVDGRAFTAACKTTGGRRRTYRRKNKRHTRK